MDPYSNHFKSQTNRFNLFQKKNQIQKVAPIYSYLGLGSNIGDKEHYLKTAIELVTETQGTQVVKVASFYQSTAWGNTHQDDFLNTVVKIQTVLTPEELLVAVQKIEQIMGRTKEERWGPRIIDIDILLYADDVVNQPQLTIPHPFLTKRSFVLAPLAELDGDLIIPNHGKLHKYINNQSINPDIIKVFRGIWPPKRG